MLSCARLQRHQTVGGSAENKMFDFIATLNESKSMLSVKDLTRMLGLSERTIRRMIATRQIPSVLISGTRLFDPTVLYWWYTRKHPEALKARVAISSQPR